MSAKPRICVGNYKIEKLLYLRVATELEDDIWCIDNTRQYFDFTKYELRTPSELEAPLNINPAPGYTLVGEINIYPTSIEAAGPREVIQDMKYVSTIKDTFLSQDFDVDVNLKVDKQNRSLVEYSQTTISIHQDIQSVSERIISEIPVKVINILPNLRLFVNPTTVALTVIGGVDRIAAVNPKDILVTIDFTKQWISGKNYYEPTVSVPVDILEWQDLSPRNLELVVTKDIN